MSIGTGPTINSYATRCAELSFLRQGAQDLP